MKCGEGGEVKAVVVTDEKEPLDVTEQACEVSPLRGLPGNAAVLRPGPWTASRWDGYTQGASSDLQQATRIATAMVTQYGMGSQLVQTDPDALRVGGEVAIRVQDEVDQIRRDALLRAQRMLVANATSVRDVVAALLEHETLTGAQMKDILTAGAEHLRVVVVGDVAACGELQLSFQGPCRYGTVGD